MEAKLAERLRSFSALRRNAVVYLQQRFSLLHYLETNWIFHATLILCTVVLIVALYGTTRSLTLFSFHPLCMIIGCGIFIPEGIIAYKNHFLLETFAPIMQHSKRAKIRSIHQAIQTIGVIFLSFGFLFIIAEKIEIRHTIIPHTFHSIIAFCLLLLVIVQVIIGFQKLQYHQMFLTNRRIRRWHGDMGLLVWDLLCFTLLTGLCSFLPWRFTSVLVLVIPFILWAAVIMQLTGKNAVKDEEVEADGDIGSKSTDDMVGKVTALDDHVPLMRGGDAEDPEDPPLVIRDDEESF